MAKKARLSQLNQALNQAGKLAETVGDASLPAIRKTEKSTTPGGLLRRTLYFAEDEWGALLQRSYTSGSSVSQIVRQAVRGHLGLKRD